ncbi:hypothetical protein [Chitinophaga tropicalis]|uniref:Uncharacterized protein n=1 Tax=Chitinophaga tropicalis TaxID=2683588 RepID=A0A7K1U5I9_9BACT|nr:hypothetical protein [Chitinophaga tropicalis]MVT09632.1 hypothetical protein [Chitinophaga tropicalis]
MRKHLLLAGVAGMAALALFSCRKEQQTAPQTTETSTVAGAREGGDELDAILQDLAPETYLLAFDGLPANNYITKPLYGALSEEAQFGGSGYPFPFPYLGKLGYDRAPFRKIWIKTCPTMIPVFDIAKRAAELVQKADPRTFADLTIFEAGKEQQVLATKSFLTAAANLQPDVIDNKVTAGLPLAKFRLTIPAGTSLPYFTRGFYGTGDITQVAGATGRLTIYNGLKWEDILRRKYPNLIGCFDPEILKILRERFVRVSPQFEKLNMEEVAGGAIVGL